MKRILFLAVMAIAIVSCSKNKVETVTKDAAETTTAAVTKTAEKANQLTANTETVDALPQTTITWDKPTHDFGNINEGDVVETSFMITNTGKNPMIINNAKATCGCTVPKVEKNTPIAPGESTEIGVRFNSTGKPGKQTKTITLTGNFPTTQARANITAQVAPKAKPATADAMGADDHAGHDH